MLRTSGERKAAGASARREDFGAVKAQRLRERAAAEAARAKALQELQALVGQELTELSDEARVQLLELHARALSGAGGALTVASATAALPDGTSVRLLVRPTPGRQTRLTSPTGSLCLHDLTLTLSLELT
jgi:hypothetical protein